MAKERQPIITAKIAPIIGNTLKYGKCSVSPCLNADQKQGPIRQSWEALPHISAGGYTQCYSSNSSVIIGIGTRPTGLFAGKPGSNEIAVIRKRLGTPWERGLPAKAMGQTQEMY
jgi:hypothetical protein